tara:strand:+ start:385 stop:780 length:396 start_codon:yes stop_codon:yes gene_type:complete
MDKIEIPNFAKIKNYRTMNKTKKDLAVEGNKKYQLEWMKEEINEFYEAINNQDEAEILDEAIGLIRAAQQFSESKRVLFWWEKIHTDVKTVLSNKQKFDKAFVQWKKRKTLKKQALNVTKKSLINFAQLFK